MIKLIGKLALISILSVIPVVSYNYFIDPYFVFREDVKMMYVCPNERWVKTEFLIKNPTKYDSLLFGSSRVSQIPVEYVRTYSGKNYYNMTLMAGVPADYLHILKQLIRNKVTVRHIMVGLDYYSFEGKAPLGFLRAVMYPDDPEERLQRYLHYLFLNFDTSMMAELKFDGKDIVYDIFGTGEYTFVKKERNLEENPDMHRERFKIPVPIVCSDHMKETISDIRRIVETCRDNGITVTFFINPEQETTYLCDNIAFLNKIRRTLAEYTDYWDFSRPTAVTGNIFNYVDYTHYRKAVGKMMAARIFNAPGVAPAGFGNLVTRTNVDAYLNAATPEYDALKKEKKPACMPCIKTLW